MTKLKTTFFEIEGRGLSEVHRRQNIARLFGLDSDRVYELWYGASVTEEEYELLGRAPSAALPEGVWVSKRKIVIEAFKACADLSDDIIGDFELARRENWVGLEDDGVLMKPANIMTPFIRVRPRRLMQSLRQMNMLSDDLLKFAAICYRSNFTTIRFVATVAFYAMAPALAQRELMMLMDLGGAHMTSNQWVSACKLHHGLVKVMRRGLSIGRLLTWQEVPLLNYFQNLAGRDQYLTQEQFDREVIERQRVPDDYVKVGNDRVGFEHEFKELLRNELMATDKLRLARTWESFNRDIYLKLPGGSTSMPDKVKLGEVGKVVGIEHSTNFKLSGNKRLRAEFDPIMHFLTFGLWIVYAFLKYEVGKVRYLYPADFRYTVLGLYIMDHMYNAFQNVSGIDMGHNVYGSVAVKLGVLSMVARDWCGINADGKGFNENHSWADMKLVYECCRYAKIGSDRQAYQELMAAINKYVASLKVRKVILNKIAGVKEGTEFLVYHTLFSGEATTQLVNTMLLFGLAVIGTRAAIAAGCSGCFKLFLKGDDFNGFCENWLEGVAVLHYISFQGMKMEPDKDHSEKGHSEHERCNVSVEGYGGSLARRVGAAVAAEPQGSRGLRLEELVATMAEHQQSMICRGGSPRVVEMFSRAMMLTYFNRSSLPNHFWAAMYRPKCVGGFGLWLGDYRYYRKTGKMPAVQTRIKLSPVGKLTQFGKAYMTDPVITQLSNDYGMSSDNLRQERDEMVADAIESGLGPEKYDDRRAKNAEDVLAFIASVSGAHDKKITLSGAFSAIAMSYALELEALLKSPEDLRYFVACTPEQVINRQLSRSRCINANLFKRLHGIKRTDDDTYISKLISGAMHGAEASVVTGLSRLPFEEAKLFYLGKFDIAFYGRNERINSETAALVKAFTLQRVAESGLHWNLRSLRQLNAHVKWEWILTDVAAIVWQWNKDKLQLISF